MHSNVRYMLSKIGCALPFGSGAIGVLCLSRAIAVPLLRGAGGIKTSRPLEIKLFIHLLT